MVESAANVRTVAGVEFVNTTDKSIGAKNAEAEVSVRISARKVNAKSAEVLAYVLMDGERDNARSVEVEEYVNTIAGAVIAKIAVEEVSVSTGFKCTNVKNVAEKVLFKHLPYLQCPLL